MLNFTKINYIYIKITNNLKDLVNDLMMLMASFSGKLYGRRSAKRRIKK